jgi:hypothetical protein
LEEGLFPCRKADEAAKCRWSRKRRLHWPPNHYNRYS